MSERRPIDSPAAPGHALLWRALLAFVVQPVLVAGIVPWFLLRPAGRAFHPVGLVPLIAGTVLLLWCVRDFYVAGKGTLAPWDPPRELVVVGLYRYTRNPMYVAVTLILVGWALAYRTWGLAFYAAAVAVAFHLRVVLYEEPTLSRLHGEEWNRYRARVPRWFGRVRGGAGS